MHKGQDRPQGCLPHGTHCSRGVGPLGIPLPGTAQTLALFVTDLCMNLQLGTIQVYISAVSYLHHMNGHRSPASNNPMIKFLVQGVERSMPAAHLKPKRRDSMVVVIKKSKTDQRGESCQINVGRTHTKCCPHLALQRYLGQICKEPPASI